LGVDSGGVVKLGPGLSFSWKRALGVTKAKRQASNWASSCRVVGGEWNLIICS